jgi:FAD/FMN-containing dehydrogenase
MSDQAAGTSWGRWPRYTQKVAWLSNRFAAALPQGCLLPYGNGRSYGDVCLNEGGTLLATRGLDRFIRFDPAEGVLECEAGVLLAEIIELVLGHGWFLPVTPGTRFVTVGGAIANDVHGKNHHRVGSFGNHVLEFDLLRSDGQTLQCSMSRHPEWFRATIGGLGLTGLIRTVKLQLRRVPGPWIRGDSRRFGGLREFFSIARESDAQYEYTIGWIDCAATGPSLGRGVFMRGNHSEASGRLPPDRRLRVPFTPPVSLINAVSIKLLNRLYYHRPSAQCPSALWHYRPFFYPLDGVLEWNRIYGPSGFFQYQCVIPEECAIDAIQEMLEKITRQGVGSVLAVLKLFGRIRSRGIMSFPRPGATLALDFPNRGPRTLALLASLDEVTCAANGAVYPAKDARMSAAAFKRYFPDWERFRQFVDPRFSSSFWRRVTEEDR